jgi:hypothetical protein
MATLADDLAFFGDHRVAALGTGVKEGLRFRGIVALLDPAEIQQGGKGTDDGFLGGSFGHRKRLPCPEGPGNPYFKPIWNLMVEPFAFKLLIHSWIF